MWQIEGAILGHYFKVKSPGIDHFVENHFAESHFFDQKSPMGSLRQKSLTCTSKVRNYLWQFLTFGRVFDEVIFRESVFDKVFEFDFRQCKI